MVLVFLLETLLYQTLLKHSRVILLVTLLVILGERDFETTFTGTFETDFIGTFETTFTGNFIGALINAGTETIELILVCKNCIIKLYIILWLEVHGV